VRGHGSSARQRHQRHQAPRRLRSLPDIARHDPRRVRRGRFDAEHHHDAALTSPSMRPPRSETRAFATGQAAVVRGDGDPPVLTGSSSSMRSVSSVPVRRTASRVTAAATKLGGTRADNGVMSNHDDRDGEEADVAYEAVAQLTVLAGSGGTRSRHKSTLKAEINMSAPR
jgi:hypothetical protein